MQFSCIVYNRRLLFTLVLITISTGFIASCATSRQPEVFYAIQQERELWMQGIAAWRDAHPMYANYIIKAGFGGPSRNEQSAKRDALRNAYEQFGGALNDSELEVLDEKTIHKTFGQTYFWYSDVYVGYNNARQELRSILSFHLSSLQNSLPKLNDRYTTLSTIGWPTLVIGSASAVLGGVSFYLNFTNYYLYKSANTSPKATEYRQKAEFWNSLFMGGAAGSIGLPLGSIFLLARPDIEQVQQQIDKITELLSSFQSRSDTR